MDETLQYEATVCARFHMESKEFLIDLIFPVSNRNKDQEYLREERGKCGRCLALKILPLSSADNLEISETQTPRALNPIHV